MWPQQMIIPPPMSIKGMCVQENGCLMQPDAELDQQLVRELDGGC